MTLRFVAPLTLIGFLLFGCAGRTLQESPPPLTQTESDSSSGSMAFIETSESAQKRASSPAADGSDAEPTRPGLNQRSTVDASTRSAVLAPEADRDAFQTKDKARGEKTQVSSSLAGSSAIVKNTQQILDEALDFCQLSQEFWQKGELENALEALDQAYSLILKVDENDHRIQVSQQKEDLRFLISKRILEIHASRHIVVNGEHNAIPRTLNNHVKAEIKLFTVGGEKKFFRESYRRSGRYRPMIVKAITEAGLPQELSWLPLIESGFKIRALSKARALGLWQFIPSTGYKFGLSRDRYIDERLDPVKATHAAIAYLKELHQIFGDWATVLAAYNCGEHRVLRVIRSQNINYLDNFWDLYQRLPRETARYVPRFLATLHILENPARYGLDTVPIDPAVDYETVKVNKQVNLKNVARSIGSTARNLSELNPELRYQVLPNEPYELRVPVGKRELLVANLGKIPVVSPPERSYAYHKVRKGETLSSIARRYRTSIHKIARANRLNKRYLIVAGQNLKIPGKSSTTYRKSTTKSRAATPKASIHKVRKGDNLWIIARRYGTTTRAIQRLNRLPNTKLQIGQVLKIPAGKSSRPPSSKRLKNYRVKAGDSPFMIAKKNQMPLERFLRLNRLTPRSKIYPGQILHVE